jgi:hypothetical protein
MSALLAVGVDVGPGVPIGVGVGVTVAVSVAVAVVLVAAVALPEGVSDGCGVRLLPLARLRTVVVSAGLSTLRLETAIRPASSGVEVASGVNARSAAEIGTPQATTSRGARRRKGSRRGDRILNALSSGTQPRQESPNQSIGGLYRVSS